MLMVDAYEHTTACSAAFHANVSNKYQKQVNKSCARP